MLDLRRIMHEFVSPLGIKGMDMCVCHPYKRGESVGE